MTIAVLVNEEKNNIREIDLDISPEKNEIYKILKGKATFLGQWPEKSVVIVTCESSMFELKMNLNRLPRPFTNMSVFGRILLIRMDENSEPQNFTLEEYHKMTKETHPRKICLFLVEYYLYAWMKIPNLKISLSKNIIK